MIQDTLSTPWDGSRLSMSSFPRQGWPRLSPSYAPPAEAGPSHHVGWLNSSSATEQSDQPSRQPSLRRQSEGTQASYRPDLAINLGSGRPSTIPTQPVLVRAYSGNAEGTTAKPSTMSPRRLFPFTGPRSSAPPHPSGPPLPTDKDFSIESILQAIEPDIKETLDSIAEICGRSKLSLANEYGSHIAPLGEIRAPSSGLVPVEEASPSDELRANEGVVILEGPNLIDASRDLHRFSSHRYMATSRQAATVDRNGALISQTQQNATGPVVSNGLFDAVPDMDMPSVSATRDYVSKPKGSSRDLLAGTKISSGHDSEPQDVVTPAVVSEIHLDAQADDANVIRKTHAMLGYSHTSDQQLIEGWQAPEVIRSLLGRLKWTAQLTGPETHPALQSAESRLRAMLVRSLDDRVASPAV